MSNQYFQFKQFRIEQDKCAMKVSTDACIQGAWTPVYEDVKHVLDIGAGTGLLSLMLAQRNSRLQIDAIEIDDEAAKQASENVEQSLWADRVHIVNADVRAYVFPHRYDMIISNPPFFQNSLLGDAYGRNLARHTISLSHTDLLRLLEKWMSPSGYACLMLPYAEQQLWEQLLTDNGWQVFKRLLVFPGEHASVSRVISLCSKDKRQTMQDEQLIIRSDVDHYTPEFTDLLQSFYLQL
jgi:tRNA1Val (adenine37-N6)-methyltransferase